MEEEPERGLPRRGACLVKGGGRKGGVEVDEGQRGRGPHKQKEKRKGGFVKGGNGEYVAQAWQGVVRKVGISGDGRRVEVEGGFTVIELNEESKR